MDICYHYFYKTFSMNWIFLIIAGFFEVGFATCLGKAKGASGTTAAWWIVGFLFVYR